jgi:von Willebrand factor A domain-containing protein 8
MMMQKLSEDETSSITNPISLRALIRVATFCERYGTQYIHSTICRSLMLGYITPVTRDLIINQLSNLSIVPSQNEYTVELREIAYLNENSIRIGDTIASVFTPKVQALVPEIIFYNIPKHTQILELMLKDYLLGEHLLLIGSQVI